MSEANMSEANQGETAREDAFNLAGRMIAQAIIDTARNLDKMAPEFRAAGLQTLEELWMRLTGRDLNIDDLLLEDALFRAWQEGEKIQ